MTDQHPAAVYRALGWATIRVAAGGKMPLHGKGWQHTLDEPDAFQPGDNIGVKLGEPSGWLIDVDLDCPEAIAIAPKLLPATATFGRNGPGKVPSATPGLDYGNAGPRRHWVYVSEGLGTFRPANSHCEIRSTGGQTVFPGSIHESGEPIVWVDIDGPPTKIDPDELRAAFCKLALATVWARAWQGMEGARHDALLALAGALYNSGWPEAETLAVLDAAIDLDAAPHRRTCIVDTYANTGNRYGWPRLSELIDPVAFKALERFAKDPSLGFEDMQAGGTEAPAAVVGAPLNDDGNAQRLAETVGEDWRFCEGLGWLRWEGTHWATHQGPWDEMRRLGRSLVEQGQALGGPAGKALAAWGVQSGNRARVAGALDLAANSDELRIRPDDLDADPWLLAVSNGVLDLRTGDLREPERADLITHSANVAWDPDATAPRFEQFLTECMAGRLDLAAYLLRFLGYSLTGITSEHCFGLWHGAKGRNGKGTLIRLMLRMLGSYAGTVAPEILLHTQGSQHPTGLMDLRGRRLVCSNEAPEGKRWNESLIKQLTGGDAIKARAMRQDFVEFTPTHKLVVALNPLPVVKEQGRPFWSRVHLVPWEVSFEGREDHDLDERLWSEAPGVLRLLVAGCQAWLGNGKRLQPPGTMRAALEHYRESQDTIGAFLQECLTRSDATLRRKHVFERYRSWASEGGEPFPLSARVFYRVLEERGLPSRDGSIPGWSLVAG